MSLNAFKTAVSFLTVLPVKSAVYDDETLKKSLYYYSLTGLITSLALYLTYVFFRSFSSIFIFNAVLLLTAEYIVSNFFHIDGFCDTVDALYFTKKGKDKLEILKDPRVGMYALAWTVILFLFKFALFYAVFLKNAPRVFFVYPVLSYLIVSHQVYKLPTIFSEGLGASLKKIITISHIKINAAVSFIIILLFFGYKTFYIAILYLILSFVLNKTVRSKFGGFNGDTLGFSIEILKAALLMLSVYIA